jgi:hypothetical protein
MDWLRRRVRPLTSLAHLTLALSALAVLWPALPVHTQALALPPELEKVRAAFEKYRDPVAAVRDGYFSTLGCIEYPRPGGAGRLPYPAGGMGIHFLNPQLIGPLPDPMRPPILLYEPDGDKLRLVGVEWFIPIATGITERPQLFGQPFDGPMEGHEPLLPEGLHHYDLHVWLWKANRGAVCPNEPRRAVRPIWLHDRGRGATVRPTPKTVIASRAR